ncbi:unnamed protein product [Brassicogethes aeneus]|uniref:THAP-type domain-containing protein n=1 Tax=Brassicogethes aeneus TaxID=1431903 RepID=A0A9P0BDL2_BRAAE|nr:unnamed protein product [Brassicogethes aeneus]
MMGKVCCVPGCNVTNRKVKRSIFQVPKNVEYRQKWSEILNCQLTEKSNVCERHFSASDMKSAYFGAVNGRVLLNVPFVRKSLKQNALPVCEQDSNKECFTNTGLAENYNFALKIKEEDPLSLDNITPINVPESNKDLQSTNSKLYMEFKERLLKEDYDIKLPVMWSFYKNASTMNVIFYYMEEVPLENNSKLLVIKPNKMISFGKEEISLIIRDSVIKETDKFLSTSKPTNLQELEHILKKVDAYNICQGGPPSTSFNNVRSECGFKSGPTWRHKDCYLILDNATTCPKCISLYQRLSDAANRANRKSYCSRIKVKSGLLTSTTDMT